MNTVVYYPHIYPTPEWLKVAALCWDKVYRLSPHLSTTWNVYDPVAIRNLNKALGGILVDIDIKEVMDEEVQRQFEQWIDARSDKLITDLEVLKEEVERPLARAEYSLSPRKTQDHKVLEGLYDDKYPTTMLRSKFRKKGFIDLLEKRGLAWTETSTNRLTTLLTHIVSTHCDKIADRERMR